MTKRKNKDFRFYPILIFLFAINILIIKWAGIGDTFDYIWYLINKLCFVACLMITSADISRQYIKKTFHKESIVIAISAIISLTISFALSYIECSLSILFSLFGDFTRMITFTPKVFYNNYIAGTYVWNLFFLFVYCNLIYALRYLSQKYEWDNKLAGKFGYVFSENIARIDTNTVIFPRDFLYDEMLIYTPGDGRVMIVSKELYIVAMEGLNKKEFLTDEEKKFKDMISSASLLDKIDAVTVEFDEIAKDFIEKDNYEVVEHDGWYELLPLNLIEENEKKFHISDLLCSQATIFLLAFGVLTYSMISLCLEGDWHFFEDVVPFVEHLSFISLMISVAQYCCRFVMPNQTSKKNHIVKFGVSAIVVLMIVIGINNMYNYLDFGFRFNWPKDINYITFLLDDITYHVAFGWLRYPAVLLMYTLIYLGTYHRVVHKGIKKIKRILIDLLSDDEE